MTNEEALKVLEAMVNCDTTPNCEDCYMHLKDCSNPQRVIGDYGRIFLKVLKKSIPEQVSYYGGNYVICPNCGMHIVYPEALWEKDYCAECGQRLKWFGGTR